MFGFLLIIKWLLIRIHHWTLVLQESVWHTKFFLLITRRQSFVQQTKQQAEDFETVNSNPDVATFTPSQFPFTTSMNPWFMNCKLLQSMECLVTVASELFHIPGYSEAMPQVCLAKSGLAFKYILVHFSALLFDLGLRWFLHTKDCWQGLTIWKAAPT